MRQHKDRTGTVSSIKKRTIFQVNRRMFKTIKSAARYEAWRLICDKYAYIEEDFLGSIKLSDIKQLHGMECECCEDDSTACEIHSRFDGYFQRLHKRISAAIEKRYIIEVGV